MADIITPISTGGSSIFGGSGSSDVAAFANSIYGVIFSYLSYAAGAIVISYIVWGGIKYIQAGSDTKKVAAARGIITSAVIGAAILIGLYTILGIGLSIKSLVSTLSTSGGALQFQSNTPNK